MVYPIDHFYRIYQKRYLIPKHSVFGSLQWWNLLTNHLPIRDVQKSLETILNVYQNLQEYNQTCLWHIRTDI